MKSILNSKNLGFLAGLTLSLEIFCYFNLDRLKAYYLYQLTNPEDYSYPKSVANKQQGNQVKKS